MNRPVIFLDFDGVLNTEQNYARHAAEGKPNKDVGGRFSTLALSGIFVRFLLLLVLRLSFPHRGVTPIVSAVCA